MKLRQLLAILVLVSSSMTTYAATVTIGFEASIYGNPYGLITNFRITEPLYAEYNPLGLRFGAVDGGVGGTIVSEDAFIGGGRAATSGSHYFAFVRDAVYNSGAIADRSPLLTFTRPVSYISGYVAGGYMTAYDENFNQIDLVFNIPPPHQLAFLEIASNQNNIKYVVLEATTPYVILDDLTFTRMDATVPLPAGFWMMAPALLALLRRNAGRTPRRRYGD